MTAELHIDNVFLGTAFEYTAVYKVVTGADSASSEWIDPLDDEQLPAFGTGRPQRPGPIAGRPRVTESLATWGHFIVEVPYAVPNALTPGFGGAWVMTYSSSLESLRVSTEPQTSRERADRKEPRIVGPYAYVDAKTVIASVEGGEQDFTAGKDGVALKMIGPRDTWRRVPAGMDIFKNVGTVTLTKQFPDASLARLAQLSSHGALVNNDVMTLPGWPPQFFGKEQLMLGPTNLQEVNGAELGQGKVHVVTLNFLIRPSGWQEVFLHEWTDPDTTGAVAAVVLWATATARAGDDGETGKPGDPVIEKFRRQFLTNFGGWVESL